DHAAGGAGRTVVAAGEGVDHAEGPPTARMRRQLVDHAEAVAAPRRGHAEEVTGSVKRQRRPWAGAVVPAGEVVQDGLAPGSARVGEFVDDPAAALAARARAPGDGAAIEVALRVQRHTLVGLSSVGAAAEAVED